MQDKSQNSSNENTKPGASNVDAPDKKLTIEAHTQADKDMEEDAEFTASSPNDDLDEAESVKLSDDDPLPV